MYCFPQSIPHMVVSSKQTINGELELHALTPFGHVDISFFMVSPEKNDARRLDIRVEGDTASWMLEQRLPQSFRETIIGFIGRIALLYNGWPEGNPCELSIRFGDNPDVIQLTGHLMPCASASAGGLYRTF